MSSSAEVNNLSEAKPEGTSGSGIEQVSFKALRLRPGMFLHAQPILPKQPITDATPKYDAQFLGIIDGKGVMVVPHGVLSLHYGMQPGENFLIRGFTGQHDFSFAAQVIRIFDYSFRDPPLAYALLSYPETVEARMVRGAMRIRTSLPAVVSPVGENRPIPVTMKDLSVAGSLVSSPVPLGEPGQPMTMAFSIDFENEKQDLVVSATICRSQKTDSEEGYLTGFLFKDVPRNDKLLLYYFVLSAMDW